MIRAKALPMRSGCTSTELVINTWLEDQRADIEILKVVALENYTMILIFYRLP